MEEKIKMLMVTCWRRNKGNWYKNKNCKKKKKRKWKKKIILKKNENNKICKWIYFFFNA